MEDKSSIAGENTRLIDMPSTQWLPLMKEALENYPGREIETKVFHLCNLLDIFDARRQAYSYHRNNNYNYDPDLMLNFLVFLLKYQGPLPLLFTVVDNVATGHQSQVGNVATGHQSQVGNVATGHQSQSQNQQFPSPFYYYDIVFDFYMSPIETTAPKTSSKGAAALASALANANPNTGTSGRHTIYVRKRDKKKSKMDERDNYRFINLEEWFYNPMNHVSQPKFFVLDAEKKDALLKHFNIEKNQIPKMDCTSKEDGKKEGERDIKGDVVGRYLGFNSGDIVEIQRVTKMNGVQSYYRKVS